MCASRRTAGVSLVELLIVLVLIGVLTTLAVPSFREALTVIRIQGALDRLAADLHLSRMLAVREGRTVELVLDLDERRCVSAYDVRVQGGTPAGPRREVAAELPGLCLRSSASPRVGFDSRGLSSGTWQSLYVAHRGRRWSVVVSSAGRIRRSY